MSDTQQDQWYYATNGQQQGPVGMDVLRRLVSSGNLMQGDLVWRTGMSNWEAAGTVPGLFQPAGDAAPAGVAPVTIQPAPTLGYGRVDTLSYHSPPAGQVQYAGFGLRFCAAFIDGILLGISGAVVGVIFGAVLGAVMAGLGYNLAAIEVAAEALGNLIGIVIGWLYAALLESSRHQATLGKMLLGIRVTGMNGQRISFARATGRHFAKWISAIILLIGYIMAAFTEKKQALHDIIASTLVVRK
jgi:uncharacterized RDD family membrane protein YckC